MAKLPNSVDEVVYFTRRTIGEGKVVAWAYKQKCPKCGMAMMGKPKDSKTGKVQIRAKEYRCASCGYSVEKKAYEESLTADIQYTCPSCKFSGEASIPYKRKKIEGVDTLRMQCQKCRANIDITKKMKEKGKKDDGKEDEE